MFLNQHKDHRIPAPATIVVHVLLGCLFVVVLGTVSSSPASGQSPDSTRRETPKTEPWGPQIQIAVSTLGGNGIQAGAISARSVFTREVVLLADIDPLVRDVEGRARVVLMPGMSVRLFGFERLIGGAAYRGFDMDIGLRAGPGLSFNTDESAADRNRRFELVLEPFVRLTTAQSRSVAWMLELGSTRPAARFGVWLSY